MQYISSRRCGLRLSGAALPIVVSIISWRILLTEYFSLYAAHKSCVTLFYFIVRALNEVKTDLLKYLPDLTNLSLRNRVAPLKGMGN